MESTYQFTFTSLNRMVFLGAGLIAILPASFFICRICYLGCCLSQNKPVKFPLQNLCFYHALASGFLVLPLLSFLFLPISLPDSLIGVSTGFLSGWISTITIFVIIKLALELIRRIHWPQDPHFEEPIRFSDEIASLSPA
jgi:hypothetical protein